MASNDCPINFCRACFKIEKRLIQYQYGCVYGIDVEIFSNHLGAKLCLLCMSITGELLVQGKVE